MNTARTMSSGELAERMGSSATDVDARRMRRVLDDMGLADMRTADIEERLWNAALRAACTVETRYRLVHITEGSLHGWYLCQSGLYYQGVDECGYPMLGWEDHDGELLIAAEYDPGTGASEGAEAEARLLAAELTGLDFRGAVELDGAGAHMVVGR